MALTHLILKNPTSRKLTIRYSVGGRGGTISILPGEFYDMYTIDSGFVFDSGLSIAQIVDLFFTNNTYYWVKDLNPNPNHNYDINNYLFSYFVSLPMVEVNEPLKFSLNIANPSTTFTMPHIEGDYIHNYIVDWGDGNTNTVTSWNDINATHEYVDAGIYQVTVNGICETFHNNIYNDINNKLISIDSWGTNSLKSLRVYGCIYLTSLPNEIGRLSKVESFYQAFFQCTLLGMIPIGLLYNNTIATNFSATFGLCTSLTSIPSGLFDHNVNATNFADVFNGCSLLTSIPNGLFDNNINVTDFTSIFKNCTQLTSIPSELFNHNGNTLSFIHAFAACSTLTLIPSGLFDYNINVTSFANVFAACSALTSIPNGLFNNNINVISFAGAFSDCSLLASIPSGLFNYNVNATNFNSIFATCTSLSSIPIGLFDYNINVTNFGLAFYSCSLLTTIPTGLFNNNTHITSLGYTFYDCTSLTGNAPELWVSHAGANHTECFKNDTGLDNYASIPAGWK